METLGGPSGPAVRFVDPGPRYAALHERIIDEARWLEIFLQPGDAVIFDNWRVLHGRRAYSGKRVFHGCYHDRDDILSHRRVLAASLR